MQCIVMFKQDDKWRAKFEAAPGRGKASAPEADVGDERAPERMK